MTSELVLLLVIVVAMMTQIIGGVKSTFSESVPRLAIRMEKHLTTGYIFSKTSVTSQQSRGGSHNKGIIWQ